MAQSTCEKKYTLNGQGDEKDVEVAVIPETHAIPHPGTVMVESMNIHIWQLELLNFELTMFLSPVYTIVANGAVRRPRGSENFTREAIL